VQRLLGDASVATTQLDTAPDQVDLRIVRSVPHTTTAIVQRVMSSRVAVAGSSGACSARVA
jgi:hypothetical protein